MGQGRGGPDQGAVGAGVEVWGCVCGGVRPIFPLALCTSHNSPPWFLLRPPPPLSHAKSLDALVKEAREEAKNSLFKLNNQHCITPCAYGVGEGGQGGITPYVVRMGSR